MRAVQVTRLDGPGSVTVEDVPDPTGDGVQIEVAAAGVTFPDVLLTRGLYQLRPDPPFTPGSEVAGTVVTAPQGSGFTAGQRVAAFPGIGGFAERIVIDPRLVLPLPDAIGFEDAAGMPMNLLTVHFALERRGGLTPDDVVLVHGAGGGIGVAAIQLAVARGARVIAVTSTSEKAALARAAGAHDTFEVAGFKDAVAELTEGRGVDIVVDPVGGERFTDSLRSLRPEGRLLVIGFAAGEIPTVKVNRLLLNNLSVVGVGWGAFWQRDASYPRQQWDALLPLIERGRLTPPIGGRYPLEDASAALTAIEERTATGKLVLETGAS
ncbi:MAG: NADPH:quinone oxidoreductase family protein [Nitriliruptoraceae bacterium]|nr:NADPH:quinone oxidoreductase family protein [Nitriliruptoraceae bacterium]